MSISAMPVRHACPVCRSTTAAVYISIPSGQEYCSNCGNKVQAMPVRNEVPDPIDDDVRKRASYRAEQERKKLESQKAEKEKARAKEQENAAAAAASRKKAAAQRERAS